MTGLNCAWSGTIWQVSSVDGAAWVARTYAVNWRRVSYWQSLRIRKLMRLGAYP